MAVRQGNAHRVLDLLENGANANEVDDNGDNALHWAVFCGHMDLCELLLRRGADWRKKTGRAGYTVLHDAAWDGSVDEYCICHACLHIIHSHEHSIPTHWVHWYIIHVGVNLQHTVLRAGM